MTAAPYRRWTIREGTARATVTAPDYAAAKARAHAIGFKDPDAIVLQESPAGPGEREGEAQRLALRLASPNRADAGRTIASQADAGHLPLFTAANEPVLL